jgi:hypothetical protein
MRPEDTEGVLARRWSSRCPRDRLECCGDLGRPVQAARAVSGQHQVVEGVAESDVEREDGVTLGGPLS